MRAACAGRLHDFISVAAQSSYKVTRLLPPGASRVRSAARRGPSPSPRPLDGRRWGTLAAGTSAAGAAAAAPRRCAWLRSRAAPGGMGLGGDTLAFVGSLHGLHTSELEGCCFSLATGKFSSLPFLNLFAVRDFKSNVFPHTFPEKADLHMH